jgi:hypothetical protein
MRSKAMALATAATRAQGQPLLCVLKAVVTVATGDAGLGAYSLLCVLKAVLKVVT